MTETGANAVFAALHARTGVCLFTITVHDAAAQLARRAYTSHPTEYPVSGTKPVTRDAWYAQVMDARQPFVANTPEGYASLFPDHALIASLGCGSVANLPVIGDEGNVIATVNLLDKAGYFVPVVLSECIEAVEAARSDLIVAIGTVGLR